MNKEPNTCTVDMIMSRLPTVADERDLGLLRADAAQRLCEGWTADEIVSMLRCTEECSPHLEEGVALARMKRISDAVAARLKEEK